MSGAPVDLFVDLGALREVEAELNALLLVIGDMGRRPVPADGASMGSNDVADAVHRFVDRWDGGRNRIADNVRSCLRFVGQAIVMYQQTEDGLAGGPSPSTAPESGPR